MTGSRMRIIEVIVAAVLLGAALFGLWHLVVGGIINGNPRAGTFGLVLALAAGVPLIVGTWAVRRRRRQAVAA